MKDPQCGFKMNYSPEERYNRALLRLRNAKNELRDAEEEFKNAMVQHFAQRAKDAMPVEGQANAPR
jgi:hypothetical protein